MGAIMRQIVTSVLMVAMCIGSMASVIWALNFGGFDLLLLAGECIAAVSTVVLAEDLLNGVPASGEKSHKQRRPKYNCWPRLGGRLKGYWPW
jgi:hypothetical protein